jgi:hypothetical protein
MKGSPLLVCGLTLPVITGCGSSSAAENVGTGTAAIEPGDISSTAVRVVIPAPSPIRRYIVLRMGKPISKM